MATTYSLTKNGVVQNNNIKDLLQAQVLLLNEILLVSEQYEIVKSENNAFFVDVLSTDLIRLSHDLVRVAEAIRDKVETTVAA